MKYYSFFFAAITLLLASCSKDKETMCETPTLSLGSNASAESSSPLVVKDLTVAQLNGDLASAFFKNASIIDVFGDTAVLLENDPNMSRLILYGIKDGRYLGDINHRGQGPGEYRVILGAFVDERDGSVLLPNFDNPSVYKYLLSTDSLEATLQRDMVMSMIEPIGGVSTAINVAAPSFDGLKIYQYDANYDLIDSIKVDGFRGGNFNMLWKNAGTNGVFMIADTLYTLMPGVLNQTAILQRGDYALTPEKDEEVTMKVMSGSDEMELLKPYILIRDIQYTDGKMLVTTMYDGNKYSDLYDMTTGGLLYRSQYDRLSIPSAIVVEDKGGKTIKVQSLFAKNGKWYGLVEDAAMENADSEMVDENYSIVEFSI